MVTAEEHRSLQLSGPDARTPYTFQPAILSAMLLTLETSDRFDDGRTFRPVQMIAGHDARSGSHGHGADAVRTSRDDMRGGRDDSRFRFLVTAADHSG